MMKWKEVEIGNSGIKIADGNYSAKYPRSDEFETKGIPFIRANNFKNKTISDEALYYITPEKHRELKKGHLLPNDVLITTRGNIGSVAIVPERHNDSNINAQIVLLRCSKEWTPMYLMYVLSSVYVKKQFSKLITGTALKQLSVKNLKKLRIPLPPLEQQKKIAAILDAADELRQKDKAIIAKYDELTQSLFLDMFGDPVTNPKRWEFELLGDVAEIIMGQSPKGDSYNTEGKGTPLLNGPTEFGDKNPKEKQWTIEPKKLCCNNDILFCVRGATAGRMNWADKEYCIGRGLAAIRSKGRVSSNYIYLLLDRMYDYFQRTSNGSTFINISRDDISKVKIPITPISLQNQFAERVKAIESQKAIAQESLKKSEDLFNSLLQRAFKGELV